MVLRWVLAWVATALVVAPSTQAFVTANTIHSPDDPIGDTPRWDHFGATLLDHDRRTLGGGIEYAVDAELCERLLPRFRDRSGLKCEHIHAAIGASLARWSAGHPTLRFVDVSNERGTSLENETGAELDFLVRDEASYAPLRANIAWTQTFFDSFNVYGTHGKDAGKRRLLAADVVFDSGADACYHYRTSQARAGCNHFPSVVLHEVGHALALDHPEDHRIHNVGFAEDAGRTQISCDRPKEGLVTRARLAVDVVMRGSHQEGMPVRWDLAPDDLLGRDFLYPPCGNPPRPGFPDEDEVPIRPAQTETELPNVPSASSSISIVAVGLAAYGALLLRRRARSLR